MGVEWGGPLALPWGVEGLCHRRCSPASEQRSPAGRWQGLDSCHIPTLCLEIGFPAEMVSLCLNPQVPASPLQLLPAALSVRRRPPYCRGVLRGRAQDRVATCTAYRVRQA